MNGLPAWSGPLPSTSLSTAPSRWFGQFATQLATDPLLRESMAEESPTSPALMRTVDGTNRRLPEMPVEVRMECGDMARQLIMHMIADHERAIAGGMSTARLTWHDTATGLVAAFVGLWHLVTHQV